MSPEQLPWDRRDFRKHERSVSDSRFGGGGGGFGGGGPNRWREHHHHARAPSPHPSPYQQNHQQHQRWYSDFRSSRPIAPGHGKQGGWHMYSDDVGPGFLPFGSRYSDRNLEDDNFRSFGNRGGGRYFRNIRENRGSFSQKDWKSPSWEPAASSSGPERPNNEVDSQKFVEITETCHANNSKSDDSAYPLPDSLSGQAQSLGKENQRKSGGTAFGQASLSQKSEKENGLGAIDWKPLKWSRSGSLSSRGSDYSNSSSSRSMGVESEIAVEVQQKSVTPVHSPVAVCVTSTVPVASDETNSRKKPRLGWGEGLAKYEKKKVEGPEDSVMKDVPGVSVSDTEAIQLPSVNLLDKSPRVASLFDCTSPATPSSVACSFSPGIEGKESIKAASVDHDAANSSCSPTTMSQCHYEEPNFRLESLELASIANLSSLINELVQSDDPSSVETGYVQTTSLNKLLVLKVDILKALEVTESEIDTLETELKSLLTEHRGFGSQPAASSLLPGECCLESCGERATGSSSSIGPSTSQVTSGAMIFENLPPVLEDKHVALKDEEIDSPGGATSKLTEVLPSGEDAIPSKTSRCVEVSPNLDPCISRNLEKYLENGLSNEDETCHSDDHKFIQRDCHNLTNFGNLYCDIDHIYESILSSNKDSVDLAVKELNNLLPVQHNLFDISTASSLSSLSRDSSIIKEKFLLKKRSLKFKEKVITLKFKVFQHFWKEGRIISLRKLRGNSHKKFDLSRTGCKKIRSSGRSRFPNTAGSPRIVPVGEVIEFINGLRSELPFKPCRNTLKMPALILDKEMRMSRFITKNALVEDPCAVEKERSMINPWTAEEMELFIDKLAIFGKNFPKIASFLEHKTIADCIEFYYKNHKSESFGRARKKTDIAKQTSQSSTYLVANGKRWNREVNAASLDILGEASVIAASVNYRLGTPQKCTSRIYVDSSSSYKAPKSQDGLLQRSISLDVDSDGTVAADVLAGICGYLSSEAMSSCITTSVDFIDGYQDRKCQRVSSYVKQPVTPDVTQSVDDCSDESCGEMDPADWTDEEKSIFIQAVSSHGKDFLKISRCVQTRSREQCKVFFSKARKCLGLDEIQPRLGNVISGDVNGGGSDTEDACVVQACSVVCNEGPDCKMEKNLPPSDMKSIHESDIAETDNLKPDSNLFVDNAAPCSVETMAVELVSEKVSAGDAMVGDSPAVDFIVDSKERNGACGRESEARTLAVSSNSDSVGAQEKDDGGLRDADSRAAVEVSDRHHGEDNEGRRHFLPGDNLESKNVQGNDANYGEVAEVSCSVNRIKSEPLMAGNISPLSVDSHSSDRIVSGQRTGADTKSCNTEKSCVISLEQNGPFARLEESSKLFSVPIKYQRHSSRNARSSAAAVANGASEKNPQKVARVDCQQHLSPCSLPDPVQFSQILRGYPVPVQALKEVNRDVNCKTYVPLQNVPMRDEKLHSDRWVEFSLQKCTALKHQNEVVPAHSPSKEQSRDHSRSQSGSSSDVNKASRSGDVKLFGKILTSSQQKPDSYEGDDNQHDSPCCQSLNPRVSGDQKVNLDSSLSNVYCNSYNGSENVPVPSPDFWEGKRIDMSFSPLPDSALLLAKYPAAFSNHSTSTVNLDQPTLNIAIRSNNNPLNGVCVFPNREISGGNGVAGHQMLRTRELPPFSMDIKQPQDVLFSEMQSGHGVDVVTGLQQQARGMVGFSVRRGLLGGQCSGVTDPVAAIKMHYAKAQNLSLQSGNGVREDDARMSNGDVDR